MRRRCRGCRSTRWRSAFARFPRPCKRGRASAAVTHGLLVGQRAILKQVTAVRGLPGGSPSWATPHVGRGTVAGDDAERRLVGSIEDAGAVLLQHRHRSGSPSTGATSNRHKEPGVSRWGQIKPSLPTILIGPYGATSNRHPGAKSDCQGHANLRERQMRQPFGATPCRRTRGVAERHDLVAPSCLSGRPSTSSGYRSTASQGGQPVGPTPSRWLGCSPPRPGSAGRRPDCHRPAPGTGRGLPGRWPDPRPAAGFQPGGAGRRNWLNLPTVRQVLGVGPQVHR